jgi:hypothetical protein
VSTLDGIAWGIESMKKSRHALDQAKDLSAYPQKPDNGVLFTLRFQATNPRDKIFALYNICNTHITPDYHNSTRQVYSEFAKQYITRAPNLKILKLAGVEYLGSNENNLPSWVPDWHSLSKQHTTASYIAFGEMGGLGSRGLENFPQALPPLQITDDFILKITGCILDTVNTREPHIAPCSPELTQFAQTYAWPSEKPGYPTGIPRLQALLRTLTLNGQPTLMTDHGMPDLALGSAKAQCTLLLCLFILAVPGEETTIETFRSIFESLGIPEGEQFKKCLQMILPSEEIDEIWSDDDSAVQLLVSSSSVAAAFTGQLLKSCVMFETADGYLGMAVSSVESGDHVCVVPNCAFPLLLRKQGSNFILVGACFVLGFMAGEAAELVQNGSVRLQEFHII